MDKFEQQFEDMDVQSQYVENAMSQTTTLSTPQDQVEGLIQQVATENGLELAETLGLAKAGAKEPVSEAAKEQDELSARLAALKSL